MGTYAYLLFQEVERATSTIYGGGKEDYSEQIEESARQIQAHRISSTRMEALGLLGLYVACKHIDEEHMLTYMNACDSTS